MQHALVEILDIGNTGISLTDYAPMHRIDGVDYWKPMPYKAHEPRRRAQAGPGPFGTLRADGDDGETWS